MPKRRPRNIISKRCIQQSHHVQEQIGCQSMRASARRGLFEDTSRPSRYWLWRRLIQHQTKKYAAAPHPGRCSKNLPRLNLSLTTMQHEATLGGTVFRPLLIHLIGKSNRPRLQMRNLTSNSPGHQNHEATVCHPPGVTPRKMAPKKSSGSGSAKSNATRASESRGGLSLPTTRGTSRRAMSIQK